MNSPHPTAILYVRLLFALLAFGMVIGLLIRAPHSAGSLVPLSQLQDQEKWLGIERYRNQPVEIVDIKIRGNSVRDKVKTKIRDNRNNPVLDEVKFREQVDWFKNVSVRLRNVSDRSVCGLNTELYFEANSGIRMAFTMELKPKNLRN